MVAAAALALGASFAGPTHASDIEKVTSPMTEQDVRARVADAFNACYRELYSRNPIDGKYFPLPTLSADDFRIVEETDAAVRLVHAPLVGMTVNARVMKPSGEIVFEPLEFAYE